MWEHQLAEVCQGQAAFLNLGRGETDALLALTPVPDEKVASFHRVSLMLLEPPNVVEYVAGFESVWVTCDACKRLSWLKGVHSGQLDSLTLYRFLLLEDVFEEFE